MTSRARQSSPRASGFTLVELLVVIVMMAILTAVIVPEMKGMFEGELLHSTSRKLSQALGIAYRQSVSSRIPHRLRLDTSEGRFFIERRATLEESASGFVPADKVVGAKGKLDPLVRVELATTDDESERDEPEPTLEETGRSPEAILFLPDGTTEKREIRLRDRQGFGIALQLNPVTSRVKLLTLERE